MLRRQEEGGSREEWSGEGDEWEQGEDGKLRGGGGGAAEREAESCTVGQERAAERAAAVQITLAIFGGGW